MKQTFEFSTGWTFFYKDDQKCNDMELYILLGFFYSNVLVVQNFDSTDSIHFHRPEYLMRQHYNLAVSSVLKEIQFFLYNFLQKGFAKFFVKIFLKRFKLSFKRYIYFWILLYCATSS